MQFQKHNFAHNFLNAVETDKPVAWDILSNEINELILDHPKAVIAALTQAEVKTFQNPSAKDLLLAVHDNFYTNEKLRRHVLTLIGKRHTDPHFNADGGDYDKIIFEGKEHENFNMSGEAAGNDGETLNFIFTGAKNLVSNVKDKVQGAAQKMKNKERAAKNLAAKEKQRNLPVSREKGAMPTGKIIGITVAAVAAISLVAYFIYKSNKQQTAA